ncbi:hypothetical protein HBN50_02080 [Halobacteriovorax sp. GB3]|uniref:hypothetical protein n=1 Tax=Halobacteriovorax sp. GB3 TaxID=2719615 RepID=UPI00235EFEA5|nr:hypothetical protein [Halobacteriovorax sp. GB3]MDD0851860.1 hypothetical protein [Halobacteriovorax sp. GB3]
MKKIIIFLLFSSLQFSIFANEDLNDSHQNKELDVTSKIKELKERLDPMKRIGLNLAFQKEIYQLEEVMAKSGDGDVVGNGGGIVEMMFHSAYNNLPYLLEVCIQQENCNISKQEKEILKEMSEVIEININKSDKFAFIDEKYSGFFYEGPSNTPRVARTGFTDEFPIYVNIAQLYNMLDLVNMNYITALIVHEVGHQIGIEDHDFLHHLGLKVAAMARLDFKSHSFDIPGQSNYQLKVTQSEGHLKSDTFIYLKQRKHNFNISEAILSEFSCPKNYRDIQKINITNVRQTSSAIFLKDFISELEIEVHMECFDSLEGMSYSAKKAESFQFVFWNQENNEKLFKFAKRIPSKN